jgi:hypothetical protein
LDSYNQDTYSCLDAILITFIKKSAQTRENSTIDTRRATHVGKTRVRERR